MRQRPIDVNQATLFVDTQPRPVNRGGTPGRSQIKSQDPRWPHGGGEQLTERRAWSLLAAALVLLLGGAYLVRGNHYAHLHRQIQDAYAQYMQDWEREVRAAFAATSWELHVQGRDQPLPLKLRSMPAKRALAPKPTAASSTSTSTSTATSPATSGEGILDDDSQDAPSDGSEATGTEEREREQQGQPRRRRRAAARPTPLLEFRLEGLMEALHPAHVPPADRHTAGHSRLWRPVVPELRRPVAMWLRANDTRTGAVSVVELGAVAFVRETTVPAGGQGRCVHEESGVWQQDGTCSVHEYLWGLCVKVSRGGGAGGSAAAAFVADNSTGGGPGCGPEWRWQLGQWRRLDERRHSVHGRMYLPNSARNSTIVTVRHARDPDILESDLVRRLAPNVEQQILMHAVGLAMCFLGLVLLLSVGAFAAPALARRAAATWGALRGRRPKRPRRGREDGDCFGLGGSAAGTDAGARTRRNDAP
ncbi:hypothetical protein PLESTB_001132100 [Pleodorina starrii]|uniref:Uncharacterized protein n=1 Tax=Pleodorina starrii TaxID=330485 RepID=A0A9W6BSF1_9CHLO|nr:hypothetical protein PLESTM_001369500 [Pleodorina starrii]GLC56661.1 hypothetical protein PLESTB_001132100 [Pleodorina starrii]GLC69048.1 hypothetical protein PLESTF_000774000 [Pleodorina starrii]